MSSVGDALQRARDVCDELQRDDRLRPLMLSLLTLVESRMLQDNWNRGRRPALPDRWKYLNKLSDNNEHRSSRAAAYAAMDALLEDVWRPMSNTERKRRERMQPYKVEQRERRATARIEQRDQERSKRRAVEAEMREQREAARILKRDEARYARWEEEDRQKAEANAYREQQRAQGVFLSQAQAEAQVRARAQVRAQAARVQASPLPTSPPLPGCTTSSATCVDNRTSSIAATDAARNELAPVPSASLLSSFMPLVVLPDVKVREYLKAFQLTRSALQAMNAGASQSDNLGARYLVRLNMGSHSFQYVSAQIVSLASDHVLVCGWDRTNPSNMIMRKKLAHVSNSLFSEAEQEELIVKLRSGCLLKGLTVGNADAMIEGVDP